MDIAKSLIYVAIGFTAQMIDGTLGMAYGVSGRTFLKTFAGLPSALASAVIHVSEIPATLISAISHLRAGNVDQQKLVRLMIPGMIGGSAGAYLLSGYGDRLEGIIEIYLIIMGTVILFRAFTPEGKKHDPGSGIYVLGLLGGFLDASGGGGWGPIVTSTMVALGNDVKKSIGTVNTAEFLVTVVETATFMTMLGGIGSYVLVILSLVAGSTIAAPVAANLCRKLPSRMLMGAVGLLIIALNLFNLYRLYN